MSNGATPPDSRQKASFFPGISAARCRIKEAEPVFPTGSPSKQLARDCRCWGFMDVKLSVSPFSSCNPSPFYLLSTDVVDIHPWRPRRHRNLSGRFGNF